MVGNINVEIIEPKRGNTELYDRVLQGDNFQSVLHYHGHLIFNGVEV